MGEPVLAAVEESRWFWFVFVSFSFRMRLIVRFSYIKRISLVLLSLFPANVAGVGVGFLSFGVY